MIMLFFYLSKGLLGTLRPLFAILLTSTMKIQFYPNHNGVRTSAIAQVFFAEENSWKRKR